MASPSIRALAWACAIISITACAASPAKVESGPPAEAEVEAAPAAPTAPTAPTAPDAGTPTNAEEVGFTPFPSVPTTDAGTPAE